MISIFSKNTMLDSLLITKCSLHSAEPGENGANNELLVTRQDCTFSIASDGVRVLVSNVDFTVNGGDTVLFVSYWNGAVFLLAQEIPPLAYSASGNLTLVANSTMVSI